MWENINIYNAVVKIWNVWFSVINSSVRQAIIGKTTFKYKTLQGLSRWYLTFYLIMKTINYFDISQLLLKFI